MSGQRAEFHDVSGHMEKLGGGVKLAQEFYSPGSLFRLLMPEILPLDRAVYMDCDTVADMDVRELWDTPLDGRSIAGVPDRPPGDPFRRFSAKAFRLRLMGCDRLTYVNSGVLLMDLARIRKKFSLPRRSVLWCRRYGHLSDLVDQDLLNSCFQGDIKLIGGRFNCTGVYGETGGAIFHAINSPKPWEALRETPVCRLYWKTFLKTPWGRGLKPGEIAGLLIGVSANSPLTHKKTAQCYKKILRRWRRDIFMNKDAVLIIGLAWKFLRHKVKNLFTGKGAEEI
jgi:lipopolysaccharide biosynthesis glycosyltransferase